ncbi:hypothetical protein ACX9MO_10280 [Pseudooceanicola sp. 502str34]
MANAVFIQNPESIYRDRPGEAYNFPRMYLNQVRDCIDDWVVFYEGKKGAFGYLAIQKVREVVPDPERDGWYYANLEPKSLLEFETIVPRADPAGVAYEGMIRGDDTRG